MRSIYICLLFVLIGSCKPKFELKMPQPDLTVEAQKEDTNALDVLYHHMVINYDTVSTKANVKKRDFPNDKICAFSQEFEYKIEFSTASCEVSEGLNIRIKFPKVSSYQITKWIESINESMALDIKNNWNIEKTEYMPNDGQTGCYYELMEGDHHWEIIIWCGT